MMQNNSNELDKVEDVASHPITPDNVEEDLKKKNNNTCSGKYHQHVLFVNAVYSM